MTEPAPAIIQSDQPFKVEAVLSKTGGVNALAKRPKKMNKGQEIPPPHHAPVPAETIQDSESVQLNAQWPDNDRPQGPLVQDQFDTQHREQFIDPSRRLSTNQRVKIAPSESDQACLVGVPADEPSHLPEASTASPGDDIGESEALALTSEAEANFRTEPEPKAVAETEADAQEQRQQFLRRIEQIRNTNESVGKDLEALEKLSALRPSP